MDVGRAAGGLVSHALSAMPRLYLSSQGNKRTP
jgi:hypothetical protein